jgi:pimeloyl-ACP methyl ester carboxylesterase
MTGSLGRRSALAIVAVPVTGALTMGLITVPGAVAAPGAPATPSVARAAKVDTTSPLERRRVDSVPTPKLRWYKCYGYAECATARVPLDYDQPRGATTQLGVLRVRARDHKRRIGSLFVNPGGPGGSATQLALLAPELLSATVLDRFDVVGVDPRGVGASEQVRCFDSALERNAVMAPLDQLAFPYGRAEEATYVRAAKATGRACSTTGRPLTGAMSTAEVARDMDVMRRAVGDKKLTYLGFSYGSVLGQYYANMFPDRVRALAIDGVINPVDWVGSAATRETPQFERVRSAEGSYKALREILVRCDRAGGSKCSFATGDPVANFDLIARRLKARPVTVPDGEGGTTTITYSVFVGTVLGTLYDPDGYRAITQLAAQLLVATEPPAASSVLRMQAAAKRAVALLAVRAATVRGLDFPYENELEARTTVACTDGQHPADAALWPAKAAAAERRVPYAGGAWPYGDIACGRSTWTVRDEDAYTGPWTRRTSGPVLVVGNYWDPATNYTQAVAVSKLLPNSRLLSSDSWGHAAYGTSACVVRAMDAFLLTRALPRKGTLCRGDVQPFQPVNPGVRVATTRTALKSTGGSLPATSPKVLPPVDNPWLDR